MALDVLDGEVHLAFSSRHRAHPAAGLDAGGPADHRLAGLEPLARGHALAAAGAGAHRPEHGAPNARPCWNRAEAGITTPFSSPAWMMAA